MIEPGVHLYADQFGQQPRDLDETPTLGVWTAPRTWVTGELVTAALLNTHVRDNLNLLRNFDLSIHHAAEWAPGALVVDNTKRVFITTTGFSPGFADFAVAISAQWRQISAWHISATNGSTGLGFVPVRFRQTDSANAGPDAGTDLASSTNFSAAVGWYYNDTGWVLSGFSGGYIFRPGYRMAGVTANPTVDFGGAVLMVRAN